MTNTRRAIASFHLPSIVIAIVAFTTLACVDRAHADIDDRSFIGVITGSNVLVRSGPADSYYPIGRVNQGDLVQVVGERFGWARIHTTGPTFENEEFFGYIIYPKTQPGRFRISEDGKTGRTLGRTDVLAANYNTDFDPNDSWKPLIRLDADTRVHVIETLESANNIVQKIKLPEQAEVWISARFIDRADEAQRTAWKRHFEPEEPERQEQPDQRAEKPEEQPEEKPEPTPDAPEQERAEADEPERDQEQKRAEADEPEREREEQRGTILGREEQPAPDVEPLREVATEPRDDEPEAAAEEEPADAGDAEAEVEADEPTTAERLAQATLEDLEAAFELLRDEPIETAEVTPLRRMYLELAERAETDRDRRFATQRAEQLELWAEIQQNRQRLTRLRSRAEVTGERAAAARRAVDDAGDYTAVGRLSVSTIYDGTRLPQLLRLQEPGTGRTVAYIQPDTQFNLTSMLGQLIGIVGEKEYDGGLRLNLIQPRRVDILAPRD